MVTILISSRWLCFS